MGLVLDPDETGNPDLCVEIRRESIYLYRPEDNKNGEAMIFVYGAAPMDVTPGHSTSLRDPLVEVDKRWLSGVLTFFDNPENRRLCGLEPRR